MPRDTASLKTTRKEVPLMEKRRLLAAKDVFCRIKQFYYGSREGLRVTAAEDVGKTADYLAALGTLEEAFRDAEGESARLVLSCADKIREALKDKNFRLAGDLAHLGVRLCGVFDFPFFSRRRFYETVVLPLEDKHGIAFFEDEGREFLAGKDVKPLLHPTFAKKEPSLRYADADADGDFALAHPWLYRLFTVLGLLLLALPILLYAVLTRELSGAAKILGFFGAAALGVSLDSLLLAFVRQYMGHIATALLAALGAALVGISLLLL